MNNELLEKYGFISHTMKRENLEMEFILARGFAEGVRSSEKYHFHSSYEVHICVSGELRILVEDRELCLQGGDVAVLSPGTVHYLFPNEESYRLSYRFKFSPSVQGAKLYEVFADRFLSGEVWLFRQTKIYEHYLLHARDLFAKSTSDFRTGDLLFLATYALATGGVFSNQLKESGASDTLLAESIEEFLKQGLSRPLTLADLAEYLSFSPRHTERIVKQLFMLSFGELLAKKRLAAAKLLLRHGRDPIAVVAANVGYFDASHFSRAFKKAFGISPGAYRAGCIEST